MQAKFLTSAASADGFPADSGTEVAFVGRSNSGKSSAINRISGQTKLARVSKTPGRTQLINFFDLGRERRLVDLPGYGFARVPDRVKREWRDLVDSYFASRHSLAGLFLSVDIRRGLSDSDGQMIGWALNLNCPVAVLMTKCDKLSRGAGMNYVMRAQGQLGAEVSVIRFSARDGTGVDEARQRLLEWVGP